ncbi:MAG: alcohol dehydrogenase [Cenarchaeum symbiont of Oopsacas minuta]|nr:alcohol dehydrogenase [Cenarchaeum symbiont of Oopsacas minuta]
MNLLISKTYNLTLYMRAAVIDGNAVFVKDFTTPEIGNGDILVRMESCGICGSDVEKVFGRYSKPSTKLGHEPAGTVLKVGSDVSGIRVGDRVFTHHHVACGRCHLCKNNCQTLCDHYSKSNLQPCGLAEEYVVPEWNVLGGGVLKLPKSVSFDDAAMIEPLACCVRSWNHMNANVGDTVAVFGAGPTGLLHAMLAKHYRMGDIVCIDPNKFRTEFAQKHGIAKGLSTVDYAQNDILSVTDGHEADISIVATGSMKALHNAIKSTRSGGTIMMFGVPAKGSILNLDLEYVYSKELKILTSYAASDKDTAESLNLIASGKISAGTLITHRYALEISHKAFNHAHSGKDAMKILITREHSRDR